jgi:hypothetical protein
MSRHFDEMVDLEGLEPAQRDRLRRVHEQLLAAGAPPELTPALQAAPADGERGHENVVELPRSRRRSLVAGLAFAAAVAAACFAGGFLLGNRHHNGLNVVSVVPMQGSAGGAKNSHASIRVGRADTNGNWPLELSVTGLPKVPGRAYYILMLEQNGKPRFSCGYFRVSNGTTTVRFMVPYRITKESRWVVTKLSPGNQFPGHVVMRTA